MLLYMPVVLAVGCKSSPGYASKEEKTTVNKVFIKPPASFQDTIIIDFPAAVFYGPDSIQLKKIKAATDTFVFDGMMHEYFYLARNAHFSVGKMVPPVKIIEVKRGRFIHFTRADNSTDCIDLDTKKEPFGLFLFNAQKPPRLADMSNVDSELGFYFSQSP